MDQPPAFTTLLDPKAKHRTLQNRVGISLPWHPKRGGGQPSILWTTGIWDTGATITTFDISLVQQLGLKEIDRVPVNTAKGTRSAGVYFANVYLPSNVAVGELTVIDGEILGGSKGGGKVLIGMDIISSGDFAVSNYQNRPTFTFRMPSQEQISFVPEELLRGNSPSQSMGKVGRNNPCPCGSGKKYKKCCGR